MKQRGDMLVIGGQYRKERKGWKWDPKIRGLETGYCFRLVCAIFSHFIGRGSVELWRESIDSFPCIFISIEKTGTIHNDATT